MSFRAPQILMYRHTAQVEYPSQDQTYEFKMTFKDGKSWTWSFLNPMVGPYDFITHVVFEKLEGGARSIRRADLYLNKFYLQSYTPEEGWRKEEAKPNQA